MSVVNKMLNDLDARAGFDDGEGAEYQEPPETKRIRYMIAFIVFVVLFAAGYFVYRAMGPEYFQDLYVQVMNKIEGSEPEIQENKKVSVNSALEQMMPTRAGSTPSDSVASTSKPEVLKQETTEKQQPEATLVADVQQTNSQMSEPQASDEIETTVDDEMSNEELQTAEAATPEQSENLLPGGIPLPPADLEPIDDGSSSFVQLSDVDNQDSAIAELNGIAAEAVAANDVSQAIRAYREVLELDQRNHEARKKLAVLHYSYDENGAASVVLNEGIELAPERVDFRLMLARLFYREKKLKQAYAVLAQIEPEVQRNIDFYGLKATVAQELELNAESSHLYGRLVIFEPNRAQWWLGLAVSLDRMGQNNGALRAYENAADLRQLSASVNDFIRQRILELGG